MSFFFSELIFLFFFLSFLTFFVSATFYFHFITNSMNEDIELVSDDESDLILDDFELSMISNQRNFLFSSLSLLNDFASHDLFFLDSYRSGTFLDRNEFQYSDFSFRQTIFNSEVDCAWFSDDVRLNLHTFNFLLRNIGPILPRNLIHQPGQIPHSAANQIAASLRWLSGSVSSMKKAGEPNGMCAESTWCAIWNFVEVLCSIQNEWIQFPNTKYEADLLKTGFQKLHHGRLDGCVGSIDGTHIRIDKPPSFPGSYLNYKRFYSIVLLAVVGPKGEFLYVCIYL